MNSRLYIIFMTLSCSAATVIIDPGHGGIYKGMVSARGKLVEKQVTLEIAQMIATHLKERGHKVILTRDSDKEFDKNNLLKDLSARAQMASDHNADAFVSIHFNKSRSSRMRTYELYVPASKDFPAKSYQLAARVHHELSQHVRKDFCAGAFKNYNCSDGGIRAASFNVVMKAHCPALLIELDYLSNRQAEKDLQTSGYKHQLARAVADGIHNFLS